MALLKLPLGKKKEKEFLLIEIGLEAVSMARLSVDPTPQIGEISRRNFSSMEEAFDASLQAVDELAGKVSKLPRKAIIGVAGGPIKTETTVAAYSRPEPSAQITDEEVGKVLEEVSAKAEVSDYKLFFSTIASAEIDSTKVSNPIGLKGEKASLSCFIAYKEPKELSLFDKLIDEIDMELEKIIPTSYAVAKMLLKKGNENALSLRLGKSRSEAAALTKGHINEILQFDLGISNPDLFLIGFESALERSAEEASPELVSLYPDYPEVDLSEIAEKLSGFTWENFKIVNPKIEVKAGEDEDTTLSALSLEVTSA